MAIPFTPVAARARGGSLRKEPTPRRAPADGFSTPSPPVRSRGGATLLLIRGGYSSATPSKMPKGSVAIRGASHSPRALLAAKAKGTPTPLRRARARPRPAAPPAPLPTKAMKRFAKMESYKTRKPTDQKIVPLPKPFPSSRARRENMNQKQSRAYHRHEDDVGRAIGDYKKGREEITDSDDDHEGFCRSLPSGIKYRASGKKKAYVNGKPDRLARLKRAEQKSAINF